ncbi:MAG: hypothetical protein WCK67_05895 [bacterium]
MKIANKLFEIETQMPINSEYIENHIRKKGYEPLRWAIVKADNKTIEIEATIIKTDN